MLGNIITFLTLLCSAVLYANKSSTVSPTSSTATMTVNTESNTDTTGLSTSSTSTDVSATQVQPSPSTEEPIEEPQGLTSGQIAGVAVGSITGAAVVGGGIYAALRYSGKLGG